MNMNQVLVESQIGAQEPLRCRAWGEYRERGHQGRLSFEWAPDLERPEEKAEERLDLEWEAPGVLRRVLRRQAGTQMEFIPGQQTEGCLVTPAGALPLLLETERALLEKGKESLCLTLQYRLILAGEDQGRARLKVTLLY